MKDKFRRPMIICISMLFMLSILLLGRSTQAADMTSGKPPVGQPLVREGTLAMQLAASLKLGAPQNEVEAENVLATAGIVPGNGWIMDYPVTPDIAIELRTSIGAAVDSKKLAMEKDEALSTFDRTLAKSNMDVRPYASGENYGPSNETQPDASAVDSYYESGPPVVTYYAPPPDY